MFQFDQLTRVQNAAIDKILEDRHRFDQIYETIENYCANHKLIIGGSISVKKAIVQDRDPYDFNYIVYSEHPVRDALNITNDIVKYTEAVYMKTDIYGQELTVRVQDRPLVSVLTLPKNMKNIIKPISLKGDYTKEELLYIPPDYHLLQIYRDLYIPIPDEWEESLKFEYKLYTWLKKEYKDDPEHFVGGAQDISEIRDLLIKKMLNYFSTRKDVILIGTVAQQIMEDKEPDAKTLEILGTSSIAQEMCEWVKKTSGLVATLKSTSINLLSDFRSSRTTIYLNHMKDKMPILYVYNSLEYDVVPHNFSDKYKIQIGTPFVILRYILIDIWIIKVINVFGGIDDKYARNRILTSYKTLFSIRDKLKIDETHCQQQRQNDLWDIFQLAQENRYIGQYNSDISAKKELIKSQDMTPDYLPVNYYKEKGKYMTV